MRAYHIDRSNSLKAGDIISLQIFDDIEPKYLNDILDARYPLGLSSHGDQYYASRASSTNSYAYLVESLFEYERQLHFPHCTSRFQSFFAIETIDEIDPWLPILKPKKGYSLWEVQFEYNNFLKLDSSWLKMGSNNISSLKIADFAKKYWSGVPSHAPAFELLIQPPVKIVKKISL